MARFHFSDPTKEQNVVSSPFERRRFWIDQLESGSAEKDGVIGCATTALADIEFRHELACERLGTCNGSDDRMRSLNDLEAYRERRRASLIVKVQELRRKMLE